MRRHNKQKTDQFELPRQVFITVILKQSQAVSLDQGTNSQYLYPNSYTKLLYILHGMNQCTIIHDPSKLGFVSSILIQRDRRHLVYIQVPTHNENKSRAWTLGNNLNLILTCLFVKENIIQCINKDKININVLKSFSGKLKKKTATYFNKNLQFILFIQQTFSIYHKVYCFYFQCTNRKKVCKHC